MIKSISDFVARFPSVNQKRADEWYSACPFCNHGEPVVEHDNVKFYGTDRLVWFVNSNVFMCRRCAAEERGRGGKGVYTLTDAAAIFGEWVSDELENAQNKAPKREEIPLGNLFTTAMVRSAHRRVDRDYWKQFQWTDEVIDRFQLGRGRFMGHDGLHIIPMKITRLFGENRGEIEDWYIATRGGERPYRSSGSVTSYWWEIVNNPNSRIALLAEGEKDAISLSYLFPEYNVLTTWGASSWTHEKTHVVAQKYGELWVYGDNDEAGHALIEAVYRYARGTPLIVKSIDWTALPAEMDGWDVTDVLAAVGHTQARLLLARVESLQPDAIAHTTEKPSATVDIDALRDPANPQSLYQQVKAYDRGNTSHVLLLAAPPGAGKSFSLVKYTSEIARELVQMRFVERLELETRLRELEASIKQSLAKRMTDDLHVLTEALHTTRRALEEFSYAEIAWFGQYKNGYDDLLANGMPSDLCYNYEARNEQNCMNFSIASVMGKNNHDVGQFCQLSCPFQEQCRSTGYLSQERKRKLKPITFFRHEHLTSPVAQEYHRMAVIDENPTHIYDNNPVEVRLDDLLPHDPSWSALSYNPTSAESISLLASAVRTAMAYNLNAPPRNADGTLSNMFIISGARFIDMVDKALRAHETPSDLGTVLMSIDPKMIKTHYQPSYTTHTGDYNKKRCLYDIYVALLDEVGDWAENPTNTYPSRIHCVAGTLVVYRKLKLQLLRRLPVVVADATAITDLYETFFNRPIVEYRPDIYNPNARTVIIKGSDYTKSQMKEELDDVLRALRNTRRHSVARTVDGREIDLNSLINFSLERYTSKMLHESATVVKHLAARHKNLLVVTHKDFRELLEQIVQLPNVAYGHYGGLRGSNQYVDYESVLLIGAYRVPYDIVWMKIQAWARQAGLRDTIERETHRVSAQLTASDKTLYRTFSHPFANRYVEMVEAGELIQSSERIRPHSTTDQKFVYLMANRPALRYPTEVVSKTNLISQLDPSTKQGSMLNYVLAYIDEKWNAHGVIMTPSYRELAKAFKVSNSKVKLVIDRAIELYKTRQLGISNENTTA